MRNCNKKQLGELWWEGFKLGSDQGNIVGLHLEKEKTNTEFNYKLKFNLASSYVRIFTAMGSTPHVSPVHTLAPDPFHRTSFLNSENYDEASMLDSMADSAKL